MRARILALAVVAVLAWSTGPVSGHEGAGALALEQSSPVTGNQVRYVVRLTTVNDGHAAVNATITATLVAADGTPQTPVPLAAVDEDGRYGATITFPAPGAWAVRFTAVKPPAVLNQSVTITAPSTTMTVTTTTTAPPTTTSTATENGEAGVSGSNGPLIVGLLGVGAVLAGAGAWAARRRKA